MSSFCKCKSYPHFLSKNISIYAIFNNQSFNDTLTNDTISFEQLGPGVILEGDLGEKVSLSWLTSLSWAEGEVKMYRIYKEIQNLDQNFSLKSWNCCKTSPSLKALGWPLTGPRFIYLIHDKIVIQSRMFHKAQQLNLKHHSSLCRNPWWSTIVHIAIRWWNQKPR